MRDYRVVVDGKEFIVSVESLGGTSRLNMGTKLQSAPAAPVYQAPQQYVAPIAAPAAPASAPKLAPASTPAGQGSVTAPMPGNVLDVKVNVGDSVNAGDVVMTLEAMKMEIEVTSTVSGKVQSISVAKGTSVNTGDVLVVIA